MLASLTDWADGQLARMLGLVSQFGAFLDPGERAVCSLAGEAHPKSVSMCLVLCMSVRGPLHVACPTLRRCVAVADKVMVATALVLLATSPPRPITVHAMALPVAIMISREITMSALREWAAASSEAAHKAVKVNSFGKWKTAFQASA